MKKGECQLCRKESFLKEIRGKTQKYCPACYAVRFITNYCTHVKGKWDGQPFQFIPWEEDEVIRPLFGTLKPNGLRQYRTCYCEIPKKSGKSELAAAVALLALIGDDEMGAEVYSAAADIGQAGLVFHVAAQMVRNHPSLNKRLKIIDSRKRIVDYETHSFYQVLSSEAFTKHGINPSCIIFDELHAQPNDELWRVLTAQTDMAREQQIVFVITTAGVYNEESIWWRVREKARQIKEGIIENDSFLPVLYIADREKDDPEDRKVWERVNPSLGYIFTMDKIEKDFQEAKNDPVEYIDFLRFRLNIPVNEINSWMPMDKWDACDGKFDKGKLLGRLCYGGLDLSSTIDLTAFVLIFPPLEPNEKWKVLPNFYIPEETIMKRSIEDNVHYDIWVKQGLIKATSGNVVDQNFVKKDIINAAKIYKLAEVGFDPWNARALATKLFNENGIQMTEMRQGAQTLSEPMKDLLKKIMTEKIMHGGNRVLRWNADNVVVKVDENENIRPMKDRNQKKRIDGIVALIMALGRAILTYETTTVYEERGILTI